MREMVTVPRTRLDSGLRKEQILDATLAIIAESGHLCVNTSEISRRVGIVPSALYRHFRDKEQLIDALLERTRGRLLGNIETISGRAGDPIRRLRQIFLLHLQMIRDNPGIPRLIFSDAVAFGTFQRKNKLFSILNAYMKNIEDIVIRGQKEEKISRDMLPRAAAFALVSLVQNVGIILNLTGGTIDMAPEAESAWRLFEKGFIREENTRQEV
jgi:AcrR family transcriptional regulator